MPLKSGFLPVHAKGRPESQDRYYVYVVICKDGDGPGYIKFGYSRCINQRLVQVRQGSPIPALHFAIVECHSFKRAALRVETALHRYFADRRIKGEWYRFDLSDPDDKEAFNAGCKEVFKNHAGFLIDGWWNKISLRAIDAYSRQRQRNAWRNGRATVLQHRKKAYRELARYGR